MLRSVKLRAPVLAALLVLVPRACLVFGQGALTPPGAPAPTMKTLDQVEARTPINAVNTPGGALSTFRITSSGSYYLTGNVTGENGKNGISIASSASNVTIDLNGFELTGVPGSRSGIFTETFTTGDRKISVLNGSVTSWAGDGLQVAFDAHVERVTATGNTRNGILCFNSAVVVNCTAVNNGGDGITVSGSSIVRSCTARGNRAGINLGNRALVSHSTATANREAGISVIDGTVQSCLADRNVGSGIKGNFSSSVFDCSSTRNGLHGIEVLFRANIARCEASDNAGNGIRVEDSGQISDCLATLNGGTGSTGSGIVATARATVRSCVARINRANGIEVGGESIVAENRASENGLGGAAAGIRTNGSGSRIEANHTRDNLGTGILAHPTGDVIIRNTAGNNTVANFNPSSGPNFGPIQPPATATSPTANHQF